MTWNQQTRIGADGRPEYVIHDYVSDLDPGLLRLSVDVRERTNVAMHIGGVMQGMQRGHVTSRVEGLQLSREMLLRALVDVEAQLLGLKIETEADIQREQMRQLGQVSGRKKPAC